MRVNFTEEQKFTQWWLWLIMLVLFCIPVYVFFAEGYFAALKASPILLVILLFYLLKLKTLVDANGLQLSYFPFVNKFYCWKVIKKVTVIDYGFVGGWGIRFWTKYGTVYNVSGSYGLLVELNNGTSFVVGTQQKESLAEVINTIEKKS